MRNLIFFIVLIHIPSFLFAKLELKKTSNQDHVIFYYKNTKTNEVPSFSLIDRKTSDIFYYNYLNKQKSYRLYRETKKARYSYHRPMSDNRFAVVTMTEYGDKHWTDSLWVRSGKHSYKLSKRKTRPVPVFYRPPDCDSSLIKVPPLIDPILASSPNVDDSCKTEHTKGAATQILAAFNEILETENQPPPHPLMTLPKNKNYFGCLKRHLNLFGPYVESDGVGNDSLLRFTTILNSFTDDNSQYQISCEPKNVDEIENNKYLKVVSDNTIVILYSNDGAQNISTEDVFHELLHLARIDTGYNLTEDDQLTENEKSEHFIAALENCCFRSENIENACEPFTRLSFTNTDIARMGWGNPEIDQAMEIALDNSSGRNEITADTIKPIAEKDLSTIPSGPSQTRNIASVSGAEPKPDYNELSRRIRSVNQPNTRYPAWQSMIDRALASTPAANKKVMRPIGKILEEAPIPPRNPKPLIPPNRTEAYKIDRPDNFNTRAPRAHRISNLNPTDNRHHTTFQNVDNHNNNEPTTKNDSPGDEAMAIHSPVSKLTRTTRTATTYNATLGRQNPPNQSPPNQAQADTINHLINMLKDNNNFPRIDKNVIQVANQTRTQISIGDILYGDSNNPVWIIEISRNENNLDEWDCTYYRQNLPDNRRPCY